MKFHEDFQVSVKAVLVTGACLIFIPLLAAGSLWLWQLLLPKTTPLQISPSQSPRRQVEFESGQLARASKKRQQKELMTYRWQDAQHQWAKVSIERAMEYLSQNPARGEP